MTDRDADLVEDSGGQPSEDEKERIDRELMELIQELRVALTGVQILFAFLLTVPFTQRFATVTEFQRMAYFVTLVCAAVSVALLIAPTAQHRILFRQHEKRRLLRVANGQVIVGLGFLSLAMTGVVMVITDLLFHDTTVVLVTGGIALVFALFWFVAPLVRRLTSAGEGDADEL